MRVEIVYAEPEKQTLLTLDIESGENCKTVLQSSGILEQYNLSLDSIQIGIFSNCVELDYVLQENDRIEIYRPLTIDPKDARRLRAEKKRKEQKLEGFGA
ncbi:RnfH family protein [Francisellaceae bacterium]|nr:RnfH family protein [Francisellaceae bacterium]